jgi:hypothetical protein
MQRQEMRGRAGCYRAGAARRIRPEWVVLVALSRYEYLVGSDDEAHVLY